MKPRSNPQLTIAGLSEREADCGPRQVLQRWKSKDIRKAENRQIAMISKTHLEGETEIAMSEVLGENIKAHIDRIRQ
jgi:hypothetical protein